MAKILIVDDDKEIEKLLKLSLEDEYNVEIACDASTAIFDVVGHIVDLILLDLGLPDMDGQDLLVKIRKFNTSIPIIVLSARNNDDDKVKALDNGADDYIVKPFSISELKARIRNALKKSKLHATNVDIFTNGPLQIDFFGHVVKVNGNEIKLTNYEYKILCLLAENIGKTLTHNYIVNKVWGIEEESGSLRVFISSIRKKIEQDPLNPKLITTDAGIGYRMNIIQK